MNRAAGGRTRVTPHGGNRKEPPERFHSGILTAIRVLVGVSVAGVLAVAGAMAAGVLPVYATLSLICLGVMGAGAVYLDMRIRRDLLSPLGELRHWAHQLRSERLDARIPLARAGELADIVGHINRLSDEFQRLNERMDDEISRHTERLSQKTRLLQVLYDVAASINIFNDLDDLLTRYLHTLIDVVSARAATVRLLDAETGEMRLVAAVGMSDEELATQRARAAEDLMDGWVITEEGMREPLHQAGGNDAPPDGAQQCVAVPLRHHGATLGAYELFLDDSELLSRPDLQELLKSVGRHLGMAIEKVRIDRQAQRLSIMQERNLLAHELHDSLAQTLASLRFQVRMLEDTLEHHESDVARAELARIRGGLDEANTELRGLLAHFRAPMDKRGLLPALEDIVDRFRREAGIVALFQLECAHPDLPAGMEMQVIRILQETLSNIRRHAQARAVRILLRCDDKGSYYLMVEDDGVGIRTSDIGSRPGEHLGLQILQERARRLGGALHVDSEPGEGTRIELHFSNPGN